MQTVHLRESADDAHHCGAGRSAARERMPESRERQRFLHRRGMARSGIRAR